LVRGKEKGPSETLYAKGDWKCEKKTLHRSLSNKNSLPDDHVHIRVRAATRLTRKKRGLSIKKKKKRPLGEQVPFPCTPRKREGIYAEHEC